MMLMRIAMVKLSALGDIVHAMVVLQWIKKYRPEVTIDWFVDANFQAVLAHNPDIDNIHTLPLKKAKQNRSVVLLIKALRKLRKLTEYDLVIDMQGLIKSAIIAKLIPSQQTWGFERHSIRESFAAKFYTHTCQIDYAENVIKRNAALVANALNIDIAADDNITNKQAFLYTKSQVLGNLLSNTQANILLVLGASFPAKTYPLEKYAQIIERMSANFVLIWGNTMERRMAESLQAMTPQVRVAERLSLDGLKALIANMDLVIGGDTGPTHMAWALNVPSIALFGATPGQRNAYSGGVHRILESESVVDPLKIDKTDDSIQTIEVESVVDLAKQLLTATVELSPR